MSTITTKDGTEIFYKDWGSGQPIVFHHGWPLSADDWDTQMLFFLAQGYRVIAHDRRGHGRSSQTSTVTRWTPTLPTWRSSLRNWICAMRFTSGIRPAAANCTRYVARHGAGRVAKAVLIGAVPPVMVKSAKNPGGTPLEVFDGFRAALAANRAQLYRDIASGPFYGFNRPGAKVSQGVIDNWWRQSMMGAANAALRLHQGVLRDGLHRRPADRSTFPCWSCTATTTRSCRSPTPRCCPSKLLKKGTLKVYPGLPHGMCTTHPEIVNPDLLAFIKA